MYYILFIILEIGFKVTRGQIKRKKENLAGQGIENKI